VESQIRKVVISNIAIHSLEQIYEYGIETFAYNAATVFIEELYDRIDQLSTGYLLYPECKFLQTQSKIYRNLIHGNYLVIYRITKPVLRYSISFMEAGVYLLLRG
jgi:plasmid stabilization system protein ParE